MKGPAEWNLSKPNKSGSSVVGTDGFRAWQNFVECSPSLL